MQQETKDAGHERPAAPANLLRIDNVLATQPEAGPVIPDGGYGWIILIAAFYVKNIISGLTIAYGMLMMFSSIETGTTNAGHHELWFNPVVSTPLLYGMVLSLSDPVCNVLIRHSKWPRFVALAGICTVCASILMLWLSLVDGFARTTLYAFSGIFGGFGTALIFNQIDTSIKHYFRLKLAAVLAILRLAEYTGVIYTCLLLGKYLSMYGLPHSIIWYHLVVLTSGMIVLVFKKPDYMKGQQVYRKIDPTHEEDDEEAIFSKNTELQSPHTSLSPSIDQEAPSTATTTTTATTSTVINEEGSSCKQNWETFDDELSGEQDQGLPAPRELFTEGQINNNVTYSFDNTDQTVAHSATDEVTNIFLPVPKAGVPHAYLRSLTFYNNCLQNVAVTSGTFVFFTLFPSYLYYSVSFLHKESIGHIIAMIFLAALVEACFIGCWKFSKGNRTFPIAMLLWMSATGNFLISDYKREMFIVIGGILITTSTCALQFLLQSLVLNTKKTRVEYSAFRIVSGLFFVLFFIINPTYENCFRLVGLLQFTAGCISFCSFVYNKISRVY